MAGEDVLLRTLTPNQVNTLEEVGQAMISIAIHGSPKNIINP